MNSRRAHITLSPVNDVYMRLTGTDEAVWRELREYLTFQVANAQELVFMRRNNPALRGWDGRKTLIEKRKAGHFLYRGLAPKVKWWGEKHGYDINVEWEFADNDTADIEEFIDNLELPFPYRSYQRRGIISTLKEERKVLLSSTGSGKSLIIYAVVRYWISKGYKVLLIVPKINLVDQMFTDFDEYAVGDDTWQSENFCHRVYEGKDPFTELPVTISTFQAISNLKRDFFDRFDSVIGDECFVKGTKVLTPNGYVNIETINSGDKIISYDEDKKEFIEDEVVKLHKNLEVSRNEKVYELTFDNGKTIKATGNHKFLTESGWKRADELTENDEIINNNTETSF